MILAIPAVIALLTILAAAVWVTVGSLLEALGERLEPAARAAAWFHRHGV